MHKTTLAWELANKDDPQSFGKRLKTILKAADITQTELAYLIGVDDSAVSKWVSGSVKPSYYYIIAISKALGVTTDYLLGVR